MRSCLQKAHRFLERSRVHWCQWYFQLCDLHSNLMNDLILINTPAENAHNISDHVTPSLWACLIICKVRWSDHKVWPQRPLPPWSSVVTKSSCNHLGEMTSGKVQPYWQRERPTKAWGLWTLASLFSQINIWHSSERALLAQSVCPSHLHFSDRFSSQHAHPRFYLSISHF